MPLLTFSLICGCMPPPPVCLKDGRTYCKVDGVFRYEWYDYYERALSCMEGECYSYALTDLDRALERRPDDKRMARTFGMHLRDYFPHREKGLIYYVTGDDEAARRELEISLEYEESAKTLFYLDKIRRRMMEQEKVILSAPRIFLKNSSDKDEFQTRDNPVIISGVAEDEQYVSEIIIGDEPVFLEASVQRAEFEKELELSQGKHDIDIIVRNLMGGESRRKITIHVDRSGPAIILEAFTTDVGLRGYLCDASDIVSLSVNEIEYAVSKGNNIPFHIPFRPDMENIVLVARDVLGNQTKAFTDLEAMSASVFRHAERSENFLASLENAVTDADKAFLPLKKSGPEIILDELEGQNTVFSDAVSVRGKISDTHTIRKVLINDFPISGKEGGIVFFNHSVRLSKGENQLVIRAQNELGDENEKRIIIRRKIPEIFKPRYRCAFKAYPFKNHAYDSGDGSGEEMLFQSLFMENLIARDRFQIRMDEGLQTLLSRCRADLKNFPDKAVIHDSSPEKQAINPAMFMLSGHIYKTRNGVEIVAKVVDIRTSEILDIESAKARYIDIYNGADDHSDLSSIAEKLADKFHIAFPLLKGRISGRHGGRFFSDMGKGRMRMKWPLVIGSDTQFIGDAVIDEKLEGGKYWIRIDNAENDELVMGKWVVAQ